IMPVDPCLEHFLRTGDRNLDCDRPMLSPGGTRGSRYGGQVSAKFTPGKRMAVRQHRWPPTARLAKVAFRCSACGSTPACIFRCDAAAPLRLLSDAPVAH